MDGSKNVFRSLLMMLAFVGVYDRQITGERRLVSHIGDRCNIAGGKRTMQKKALSRGLRADLEPEETAQLLESLFIHAAVDAASVAEALDEACVRELLQMVGHR